MQILRGEPGCIADREFLMKRLVWGQATDKGLVRDKNEDGLFALGLTTSIYTTHHLGLFIVAGGMGEGMSAVRASRLVSSVTSSHLWGAVIEPFVAQQPYTWISDAITSAIREANRDLLRLVSHDPSMKGAGSTLDVGVVIDDTICIGHVGHSRVYLITPDDVQQLTEDHRVLHFLVRAETKDESRRHQITNTVFRALGQHEDLEVDILTQTLTPDSYLLMCSDGLTRMVQPTEFVDIVRHAADPQQACDQLIALANLKGGVDNTTVIVIAYHQDGE
jgi:serine/threonine protein phosphatase PrpC